MFEQDRFLVRLQQRVLGDIMIAACFLSGSYGRRQEDGYSDIDVALLFKNESYRKMAWEKRRQFIDSILTYVPVKSFDAVHIRPYFHIALYSTGTKVDYRYETLETLAPNPWDKDIRIIKDDNGWIEQFQAQSAQLQIPAPRISAAELHTLDERFWVMFWDTFRLVKRGNTDKSFPIYLQLLHFTLPTLLDQLPLGSPLRAQIGVAQFSKETRPTRQHLAQLLDAYIAVRNHIAQAQHLDIRFDSKFETAVRQLVNQR